MGKNMKLKMSLKLQLFSGDINLYEVTGPKCLRQDTRNNDFTSLPSTASAHALQ